MPDAGLAALPPERLVAMLREKRRAEAGLRERLREVEGERDAHAGVVAAYQRDELWSHAVSHRPHPSARSDIEARIPLESVLGEDGKVDAEKVSGAVQALRTQAPHYFEQASPRSGVPGGGVTGEDAPGGATALWSDVLGG